MLVKTQDVSIVKQPAVKGSSQITWNVSLDGKPFGQIWTFKKQAGFKFMFTAKALSGEWGNFDTFAEAEKCMRGLM